MFPTLQVTQRHPMGSEHCCSEDGTKHETTQNTLIATYVKGPAAADSPRTPDIPGTECCPEPKTDATRQ
eukprot:7632620-Pyramimonas_sp.AAC.2